ncbi:hypothetical protein OKW50_005258 [Paraburkholderia youngii]
MNNRCYRLVFSTLRGMLTAVAETAIGHGNSSRGETGLSVALQSFTLFAMRHAAFAALVLCGLAPALSDAQIVPSGTRAPGVISTANGLPQVNINKPSGAGVSLNTYSQFDVQKNGAILNNSPVITGTQLAGQINGNPNFGPNDAAKLSSIRSIAIIRRCCAVMSRSRARKRRLSWSPIHRGWSWTAAVSSIPRAASSQPAIR